VFANSGGVLRESRDVIVKRLKGDRLLALGNDPGFPGDVLSVELATGNGAEQAPVMVLASRPVVVDGIVRYELRLAQLEPATGARPSNPITAETDDK
jgi:hypothetical protein